MVNKEHGLLPFTKTINKKLFHGETVDQGQQEVLAVDKSEIMAEEFNKSKISILDDC